MASDSRSDRILIVDDDAELAQMLRDYLGAEGLETLHAESGNRALRLSSEQKVDLIVLDVMMPGLDGFDVLEQLRRGGGIPVLMLTARGDDLDRIRGLEGGADDYLSKPFNPRELVARIRAILRRRDRSVSTPRALIEFGPLKLDAANLAVELAGVPVRLTSAEFLTLEALALSPGQMQTRSQLTEKALGRPLEAYDRSIDTHISNLRRKLGLGSNSRVEIRSIRGLGYMLVEAKA